MRIILAVAVALVACGKSDTAKGKDKDTAKGGPVVAVLPAFCDEVFDSPAAAADKYKDGVTLTSEIRTVGHDADHQLMLAGDPKGDRLISIYAAFADPAALDAKAPKKGDTITITCKLGKPGPSIVRLVDCKPS